jgi:glycosyl transferase, family 25
MTTGLLINLDRSPDRLAAATTAAAKVNLPLERVPAVDGRASPQGEGFGYTFDDQLSHGEVGCYLSHLKCAEIIVSRGLPYAAIFEDDYTFCDDLLPDLIASAVVNAPDGWDIIMIGNVPKLTVYHVSDLGSGRHLVRYSRLPLGSHAYLMSNLGARKFLASRHRVRPNDVDVREGWQFDLNALGIYPPVTESDGVYRPSTIDHRTGRNYRRPTLSESARRLAWRARHMGLRALGQCAVLNALIKLHVLPSLLDDARTSRIVGLRKSTITSSAKPAPAHTPPTTHVVALNLERHDAATNARVDVRRH